MKGFASLIIYEESYIYFIDWGRLALGIVGAFQVAEDFDKLLIILGWWGVEESSSKMLYDFIILPLLWSTYGYLELSFLEWSFLDF